MDVLKVLKEMETLLQEHGSSTPRLDAEVLLAHSIHAERYSLYTGGERILTNGEEDDLRHAVERRLKGEPIAYIIGMKEFWSLALEVTRDVLIPRPDSEILIEQTLDIVSESGLFRGTILEVGTGSGALSVALAVELPDVRIVAVDTSLKALAVAQRNAQKHNVSDRIIFLCANLCEPLTGKFDIVLSNPPYIAAGEFSSLPSGVRDFEPAGALIAGPEGTEFHRALIRAGCDILRQEGWLIMEIGADQKRAVKDIFRNNGHYGPVFFRKDYAGKDRVVAGRKRR